MPEPIAETRAHPADASTLAVRRRFSHAEAAGRWHAMYAADTDNLEEDNYRRRRDVAVAEVLRLVQAKAADFQVLDLGCGTGPVLAELRRHGISVQGVDGSEDMLDHARSRLRALGLDDSRLSQGDCRDTSLPAAGFDVVVCLGVISYIEDYTPVLAECHRLLKPGGTLIISWRNAFNPILSDPASLAKHALRWLLTPVLGPRREAFKIGGHLDHRVVTRHIEAQGFRHAEHSGIGFGPFRLARYKLFSDRGAIRVSNRLDALFQALSWRLPRLWLTDVSLWVYRKPNSR